MEIICFSNQEDLLLLQKIRDQDHCAFDTLFNKYWKYAYSSAYKRLQNEEDAKDIVQEIFLAIWKNRLTLNIQNFRAYLSVAVKNRVIKTAIKSKKESPFFDYYEEMIYSGSRTDDSVLYKEFIKNYHDFVESLPPQRQKIFKMRHQENLGTTDISALLDIKRKTVQNQLGKATDHLKLHLSKNGLFFTLLLLLS